MDRIHKLSEEVVKKFKNSGYDVNIKDVYKRLKLLIDEFKVPEDEAVRTVTNYLLKELDIPRDKLVVDSPLVKIADIGSPGQWISLKAKVVQLWDSSSPNVSQVGLIGDETGIIKFVIWAKANKPEVEEGKNYLFANVVTDRFGGKMQVNINKYSRIEEIDEDISLPPRDVDIVGALVAIQQNSGLIRRCKICNRVLTKGVCPIHGKTEAYDDLRIKGVMDDGENYYEVILNEENIKNLTGIGLEEAIELARKHYDREIVLSELKNKLLGRYFRFKGRRGERYLIVNDIEFLQYDEVEKAKEILSKIGGETIG